MLFQIRACKSAGLEEVHLITEPEAAALAFGLGRRESGKSKAQLDAARLDRDKVERTLVVDLGGGTFDVSVCMLSTLNARFYLTSVVSSSVLLHSFS